MGHEIFTKRVYAPAEKTDGQRLLVMRLWPRGIKKTHIDHWLRELAPSYELLRSFKDGVISWTDFSRSYRAELKHPSAQIQFKELETLLSKGPVTLLCSCKDEKHCHRTLLKKCF
jgi:uncharacterized protein YeaO (DUF488 family)